ncbi:MAG: GTPase, partial [Ardenticatenaceae bacterium]
MTTHRKPVVAIVGRPNVGKSTLFNRLVGRRTAIVSDVAGTTRDRITTETVWADHPFILVDTGGIEVSPETDIWKLMRHQIDTAINDADIIIMAVDSQEGVTPADRDVANILRRSGKPVSLAVNKADNVQREAIAYE